MRAIVYENYGSPDGLGLSAVDRPTPVSDEVLVKVEAAAVNAGDWSWLQGLPLLFRPAIGLRKPRNRTLGIAIAGTVEELGEKVDSLAPGDKVYAEVARGGFAEFVCVPEDQLAIAPANVTAVEAAAVPVVGTTALQALRDIAQVQPGKTVLINGASGGVGTFAVQIAHDMGAEVFGVCGSSNVGLVGSLGADHVIDYTRDDFTKSGVKYDVILDNVGKRSLKDLRRALTPQGMLILNSGSGSRWFGPLGRMLRALITSLFVSQNLKVFMNRPRKSDLEALSEMIESGVITPVIDSTFVLERTAQAMAHYGDGHAAGKVVVSVGPSPDQEG